MTVRRRHVFRLSSSRITWQHARPTAPRAGNTRLFAFVRDHAGRICNNAKRGRTAPVPRQKSGATDAPGSHNRHTQVASAQQRIYNDARSAVLRQFKLDGLRYGASVIR
ncbi:hypothetical protein LMG29542_04728 [Paraburkholderia humisilvae]|uniref:Uncharacterized protein n=1 Tax=Paraburkholderia humisilvae TaxID=627669 RepID=A0A6J5EE33_9BURK|nr:hypothetical protein LMG29542_04728 [Paraburkholderia humisilvae]